MHNGELAKTYQVLPLTRKECPTKLGCDAYVKQMFRTWMKTAALWFWLKSIKSDGLRTNAFSTSTTCKSQGNNIFRICWSSLSWHYKKWR